MWACLGGGGLGDVGVLGVVVGRALRLCSGGSGSGDVLLPQPTEHPPIIESSSPPQSHPTPSTPPAPPCPAPRSPPPASPPAPTQGPSQSPAHSSQHPPPQGSRA